VKVILEKVVPGKSGFAFEVKQGQSFRIVDLEGQQVADMAVFNLHNKGEKLSTSFSRTRYVPKDIGTYIPRDKLQEGDVLLSTLCRPLMTIVKETAEKKGVHDVHNRMCNRYLYEAMLGLGPLDGCHEIISKAVAPYGIKPEDVPDTLDVNMNYIHDCTKHQWICELPVSRAGDYVEFRAEMDCLVAVSICPMEFWHNVNAGKSTPMKIEVFE
jgi:uncharacterized protein YcgI (DUF1989 family)